MDAVNNDDPEDGTEPEDIEFDGRKPEGGKLPLNERTPESVRRRGEPVRLPAGAERTRRPRRRRRRRGRGPAERKNPSPEFLYANKWRIFGVMMIGWAMSLLDVSIVNISIPELQDEMSTDIATVTWVINAYNIIFAVLLVSMGRLADQFGRKRFFVIGLTVFTIGSALCAVVLVGRVADRLPRDPGRRARASWRRSGSR